MPGQREREPRTPPPSLRDYWTNPTGFSATTALEARRRTAHQVTTPSLWEPTPGLTTLVAPPRDPGHESTQIASAHLIEGSLVSPHEHDTLHLRERLQQRGVASLSNAELLSLVLRTDPGSDSLVPRIHTLLQSYSVHQLLQADLGEFCEHYGFGEAKAAQLQAMLEVARRLALPSLDVKYTITSPADAAALVRPDMEFLSQEHLRVLALNTKNQVVANLLLYQGTVNSSVLRAGEIFRPAVHRNCPGIIVCHNHPSGDPTESPEDVAVTKQLIEAGKYLDIDLIDHIIIGTHHRFVSLKERLLW